MNDKPIPAGRVFKMFDEELLVKVEDALRSADKAECTAALDAIEERFERGSKKVDPATDPRLS